MKLRDNNKKWHFLFFKQIIVNPHMAIHIQNKPATLSHQIIKYCHQSEIVKTQFKYEKCKKIQLV